MHNDSTIVGMTWPLVSDEMKDETQGMPHVLVHLCWRKSKDVVEM